ncbi:MAG: prolyl oligopeptidase family serine peptidase [Acidimicrobiales bacterium]
MSGTAGVAQAPYGSWSSPISAELIVSAAVGLGDVWVDGAHTWWSELRPTEAGRVELVRDGVDLLGAPFSARTRVHEYGGGAWWLHGETVYFANWSDQRLHRLDPDGTAPRPITPEPAVPAGLRYADGRVSPDRRWIVCIREDHEAAAGGTGVEGGGHAEPVNAVVALPADGSGPPVVLHDAHDFVSSPRLSADGSWLTWVAWNHPNMPWDDTELWVARFADGAISDARCLIAASAGESIVQPEWGPDGNLYFCSDRSNWWNLYRFSCGRDEGPVGFPVPLTTLDSEIALPGWVFGRSRYGFDADGASVVFAHGGDEHLHLGVLELATHRLTTIETGLATFEALRVRTGPNGMEVVGVGAGFATEAAVLAISLPDGQLRRIRPPRVLDLPDGIVSTPEHISFPSVGGRQAHAWFYPPANPAFTAPAGELPPLVVLSHGGPTASANPSLSLSIQYWTSRGFAVVDVDYGGSTGYGRAYRKLLERAWGIVDVEDCCAAAEWLAAQGRCDAGRMVIRGGSAGGFTTLAALTFRSTFKAGASHYGIGDLAALVAETHKFEARYCDGLIGPYPADAAVYEARSPIHHTEGLDCPLILLQGSEDVIVPPSQSRAMAAALEAKGIPHAYLEFEGEQHGFRQAANIVKALESELSFYAQVFHFELGDAVEPVAVTFAERL